MMMFLDFETTGLVLPSSADDSFQPRAIEIALVKTDMDLNIIDKYEAMFNPHQFITPEITKITGITNDQVKASKPFSAHVQQIAKFTLGVEYLLAHNLPFDLSILSMELARIGKDRAFPYPPNQICTATMTEQLYGKRLTLKATYEKLFEKKYAQLHRAMDDTLLLLEVYKGLRDAEPTTSAH